MTLLKEVERASIMATSDHLGSHMLLNLSKEAQRLLDFLLEIVEVDYNSYIKTPTLTKIAPSATYQPYRSAALNLKDLYNLTLGCPPTSPIIFAKKCLSAKLKNLLFEPARELGIPYAVVLARLWQYWSFLDADMVYRGCLPYLKGLHSDEEIKARLAYDRAMVVLLMSPMMLDKRQRLHDASWAAQKDLFPGTKIPRREELDFAQEAENDDRKKKQRTQKRKERRVRQRLREDREYELEAYRLDNPNAFVASILAMLLMFACLGMFSTVMKISKWWMTGSAFTLSDCTAGMRFRWPV